MFIIRHTNCSLLIIFVVLFSSLSAKFVNAACRWERVKPPPNIAIGSFEMAFDSMRNVVVLVGEGDDVIPFATWEWNGTSWQFRSAYGPTSRTGFKLAYDSGRGRTVLFGGFAGDDVRGDTWEWDGEQWSYRGSSGPSPSTTAL